MNSVSIKTPVGYEGLIKAENNSVSQEIDEAKSLKAFKYLFKHVLTRTWGKRFTCFP